MSRLAYGGVVRKPRRMPMIWLAHNGWQTAWVVTVALAIALCVLLTVMGWWSGDVPVIGDLAGVVAFVDGIAAILMSVGAGITKSDEGHIFCVEKVRDELHDQRMIKQIGPRNTRITAAADRHWVAVYEEAVSAPDAFRCVTLSKTELRRFDAADEESIKRAHAFVAEQRERIEQARLDTGLSDEVITARALAESINEAV